MSGAVAGLTRTKTRYSGRWRTFRTQTGSTLRPSPPTTETDPANLAVLQYRAHHDRRRSHLETLAYPSGLGGDGDELHGHLDSEWHCHMLVKIELGGTGVRRLIP